MEDAGGRTTPWVALPALTDAHVHVWNGGVLPHFVPFGVTRVRDMASPAGVRALSERVARRRPTPSVDFGGPMIDSPGPPRLPSAITWTEAEGPVAAVRKLAADGPAWIKIYEGLPGDLVRPVVEAIHDVGAAAAVHPAPGRVRAADEAGVDSVEHVASLAWELTGSSPGKRTGRALIEEVCRLWQDWGAASADGASPVRTGTPITTTLSVVHGLVVWLREGRRALTAPEDLIAQWESSPLLRNWRRPDLANAEISVQAMVSWCSRHHRAGGRLAVGTDTPNPVVPPGQAIWWEIELLRRGGLHPLAAYRLASVDNLVPTPPSDWIFVDRDRAERAANGGTWGCGTVRAVLLRGRLFVIRPSGGRLELEEVA